MDHYQVVTDFQVGGATEKDILVDPATGDWHIAKLGRRNNDLEVITEYIIHLIGRSLGIPTADSKIAYFHGRLRFLSKYFLDRSQAEELVHGIQLFKELYDDPTVDAVLGDESREQAMFSLQQIRSAFGAHYIEYGPELEQELFNALVDMVTHDAIIGVQDRHHENWGIIVQRGRAGPRPRFAPLYDSARGMFCNMPDAELHRFSGQDGLRRLDTYITRARPLMGWDGLQPRRGTKYLTHDQLIGGIYRDVPAVRHRIRTVLGNYDWRGLRKTLVDNVGFACSGRRIALILALLRRRIRLVNRAITVLR